jgi:hypothetical protein
MADRRMSCQVHHLRRARVDVCGLNRLLFYDPFAARAWRYAYPVKETPLLAGGSLCYKKTIWAQQPFPEIDLGEDTGFLWNGRPKTILPLEEDALYVALIHPGNTNPRRTNLRRWSAFPINRLEAILGADLDFYTRLFTNLKPAVTRRRRARTRPLIQISDEPLVSCIMPTCNRRHFIPRAIAYFMRQSYANKELIIVDDGGDSRDLIPPHNQITYHKLNRKASLGYKRNLAVEQSSGKIIAHWDDDDWYDPQRLKNQVRALKDGNARICGLKARMFLNIVDNSFWSITPELHARMFFADVHGRSIVYLKDVWEKHARYPDRTLGEDALFLKAALQKTTRMVKLDNTDVIYVRHTANTWQFPCGRFLDAGGWQSVSPPEIVPANDLQFYHAVALNQRPIHKPIKLKKTGNDP